jgi:tetratricopeptide (TPR) repeat protein
LKSREQAKEELAEIKVIKGEIQRVANETEDRLMHIKTQITQIEGDAEKAKAIKDELTETLNGIEFRTEVVLSEITTKKDFALNSAQNKIIEDSIVKTREELQKSGIESIKNLYYAKALKAQSEKKWEEVIRLINSYSDFEDNNPLALEMWIYAFLQLFLNTHDKEFLKKALIKVDELIKIQPDTWAFDMKGNLYFYQEDYTNAVSCFTQAITIDPKFAQGYYNRSLTNTKLGKLLEANEDMIKAKEIDPKIEENP